jgi:hypothetical protein
LVDDAVSFEPVSAAKSLLTVKLTGNFAESGHPPPIFAANQHADPITYSRIPYATEQGISKRVSGNFFKEQGISICGSAGRWYPAASSLGADSRPDVRFQKADKIAGAVKMVLLSSRGAERKRTWAKGHDE